MKLKTKKKQSFIKASLLKLVFEGENMETIREQEEEERANKKKMEDEQLFEKLKKQAERKKAADKAGSKR